jgi:hypothetical protein
MRRHESASDIWKLFTSRCKAVSLGIAILSAPRIQSSGWTDATRKCCYDHAISDASNTVALAAERCGSAPAAL